MNPFPEDCSAVALGRQLSVEYYDCDPHILADASLLEKIFLTAAQKAHATVIESCFHTFSPQGVSGVVIISESHFAVHAWPEHDYAAVDIFTCGDKIDFDAALSSLRQDLHSGQMAVSCAMNRGILTPRGMERSVVGGEKSIGRCPLSWQAQFEGSRARGISLALDLYNCRKTGTDDFVAAAALFGKVIGKTPSGEFRYRRNASGDAEFGQPLDAGWFCGHLDGKTDSVFLDLASPCGFFEPRKAAEQMLAVLGGRYYRMQVAVRQ